MKRFLIANAIVAVYMGCLPPLGCSSANRTRVQASLTYSDDDASRAQDSSAGDTDNMMFSLMMPLYLFYAQHDRWPESGRELQRLASGLDLPFDLTRFSRLDLKELEDGSLLVKFRLAPPGRGGGEFVLARPQFEDDSDVIAQPQKMLT